MTLKELEIGKSAVIKVVGGEGALRQHFLDMGVIPGAEVTVIKFAPMGDPMELQIHGYELTLRLSDAEQIEIELISERSRRHEGAKNIKVPCEGRRKAAAGAGKADLCTCREPELRKDNTV